MRYQNQSRIADLLQSDQYYPILDHICSHLSISDVYALHGVSRSFRSILTLLQKRWLNITNHLQGIEQSQRGHDNTCRESPVGFVSDANAFRDQLEKCAGLIVGGFAVNFFNLGHGRSSCLDIYVQKVPYAESFERYLQCNEKYDLAQFNESKQQLTLCRSKSPAKIIRITKTSSIPIYAYLTSACTTTDLCFITHNKAYCLFPRQTVVNHEMYPLKHLDDDFGRNLAERAEQGWGTRDIKWPDLNVEKVNPCGSTVRRVGDQSSLIIPLDPSRPPREMPDHVVEYCGFSLLDKSISSGFYYVGGSWTLQRGRPFQMERTLSIEVQELKSPALQYQYTYGNCQGLWDDFLKARLVRWTWVELYRMKPEDRPPKTSFSGQPNIEDYISANFKPPKGWEFADDLMPSWYREWESMSKKSNGPKAQFTL